MAAIYMQLSRITRLQPIGKQCRSICACAQNTVSRTLEDENVRLTNTCERRQIPPKTMGLRNERLAEQALAYPVVLMA